MESVNLISKFFQILELVTIDTTGNELVFVIETCQNCKSHVWNTRHDENKYLEYFNRGKSLDAL
jgi:hypothetical protein